MRYFIRLMYDGTAYAGWQKQPNALSVQEVIEDRMSNMLQSPIEIVGCGRTDAGVHALDYYAHTEVPEVLGERFLFRLNNFLPADIAIKEIHRVHDDAHARFDAIQRSYVYRIHTIKNPFLDGHSFYFQRAAQFTVGQLNEFSQRLIRLKEFSPFAKLHSDVKNHRCKLTQCEWISTSDGFELHISSDRFLRGMVRLITGACLRYAEGKLTLEDLDEAVAAGEHIKGAWSVPAHGLYLAEIQYPYF